ncbi:MAG: WG repeat-containing protein [Pyrinomonadaceae bacterium]|nr:WG repeat-containing protein [Blastocatellia bacterium]MCW5955807.1 WG repeat-containing protein [Pyrinomonadaceae bacterium]
MGINYSGMTKRIDRFLVIATLVALFALTGNAQDDVLARVNYQGKYGFINREGHFAIQPQYDFALSFSDGLAAVVSAGKFGFVTPKGELVIGFQFEDALWFDEGMAAVKDNGKYGFIDKIGRLVIEYRFDDAFDFSEGLADVKIGDKCGYIDKTGNVVIPIAYETCYRFIGGTAVVQDSDLHSHLLNTRGEIVQRDTKVNPLSRNQPEYQSFWDDAKGAAGFKKRDGTIILEPMFEAVGVFQGGRSIVKAKKGKWGVIDKSGKFVLPPTYDDMVHFYEGLAAVKKDGKYGFIDGNGRLVIPPKFDLAGSFSYGLAAVMVDGKIGYINKKGNFAIQPIFDETRGGRWSNFDIANR